MPEILQHFQLSYDSKGQNWRASLSIASSDASCLQSQLKRGAASCSIALQYHSRLPCKRMRHHPYPDRCQSAAEVCMHLRPWCEFAAASEPGTRSTAGRRAAQPAEVAADKGVLCADDFRGPSQRSEVNPLFARDQASMHTVLREFCRCATSLGWAHNPPASIPCVGRYAVASLSVVRGILCV
jgi:hypothetical protein